MDGGVNADGWVHALAVTPGGNLLASGRFHTIGGVPVASGIARKVGAAWQPLDDGVYGVVHDIVSLDDGSIVAGGGGATSARSARMVNSSGSATRA